MHHYSKVHQLNIQTKLFHKDLSDASQGCFHPNKCPLPIGICLRLLEYLRHREHCGKLPWTEKFKYFFLLLSCLIRCTIPICTKLGHAQRPKFNLLIPTTWSGIHMILAALVRGDFSFHIWHCCTEMLQQREHFYTLVFLPSYWEQLSPSQERGGGLGGGREEVETVWGTLSMGLCCWMKRTASPHAGSRN